MNKSKSVPFNEPIVKHILPRIEIVNKKNKGAPLAVPKEIPDWFKNMSSTGLLSVRDLAILFKMVNNSITRGMQEKSFPQPDFRIGPLNEGPRNKKNMWRKSTIEKEINRRQKFNNSEQ